MPEIHIGLWSSGESIALTSVPLAVCYPGLGTHEAVRTYDCANGGMFQAIYQRHDIEGNFRLTRVEELMPPTPAQIQGFGDNVRLPMMERGGFSAHLEAEQRKREWAEVLTRA